MIVVKIQNNQRLLIYLKLKYYCNNLNTKVKNHIDDIEEVKKGIYYARKYHGSQMRQSGDPYYSHPIEVTIMLAEFVAEKVPKLFTTIMLQAALLYGTIEDIELTEEMINGLFGARGSETCRRPN